jgi:glutamate mutase epsilon subunit
MTADRAALVEQMYETFFKGDMNAVLDLIRAEVLEEAAVIVEFSPHSHTAGEMCLMRDKAAAIRALKGK